MYTKIKLTQIKIKKKKNQQTGSARRKYCKAKVYRMKVKKKILYTIEKENNPHPRGWWSKSTVIHKKETEKSEVKSIEYNNTWPKKKVKKRE